MKRKCVVACAAGLAVVLTASAGWSATPVGTAFTYQGQIKDAGVPANGTYDLEFRLYDSSVDGALIGDAERRWGEEITNGLFTVTLDFGSTAFAGEQRWLQVSMRRSGGGLGDPFEVLSPRQALNAAPYALYALDSPGGGGHWSANGVDIYNTNAGKVGIGTSTPAEMLHVTGANPALRLQDDGESVSYTVIQDDASIDTAQLEKRVGSGVPTVEISPMPMDGVSDARIRFFRETNTTGSKVAIFNRGDDSSAVSALIGVDGYDSWFQADGGNFGIGTNSPAYPFHLAGTANVMAKINSSNTAGTWMDFENTSTGGKRWGVVSTGSANGEGAGHLLLRNITDGRTVMTLKGTGDVGIGATAPQARLHVDGGTETAPGGGGYLVIGRTDSTNVSFDDNEIQARILGIAAPLLVNPAGGSIHLIQSGSGRVGIGTSSPNTDVKLDVVTSGDDTAIHGSGGAVGVAGWGSHSGGYFKDSNGSGEAWLGTVEPTNSFECGIYGRGDDAGGRFTHTPSGTYAIAALSTGASIYGNGTKEFVQNHPYEKDKIITYTCLEGDEVGTYTRGTGQLLNGVARIALGETFKWVTNPDIGLTAHLTPRDQAVPLAVVSLTTEELVVRGPEGGPADVAFNYIVHGLRIGFEESSVVQEKKMEAYIPSMAANEETYANDPDLRRFNALERFKAMRTSLDKTQSLDLSRAEALRDAITVYDPEVHHMPHPPRPGEHVGAGQPRKLLAADPLANHERASTVQSERDAESERQELRARVEALEDLVSQLTGAQDDGQAGQ